MYHKAHEPSNIMDELTFDLSLTFTNLKKYMTEILEGDKK